jgi:hypothetical protein
MKAKRGQLLACIGLVVLGIVVAIAGLLIAVLPQRSKVSKIDARVTAAQNKLIAMHGRRHGPVIRAAELFQLARAMPDNADMPGIVLDLARAASSSSVTLTSIEPAAGVVQPDGSTEVPIRVIVDGKWNGVTAFLRALRSDVQVHKGKLSASGRLFDVDTLAIVSGSGSSEVEATFSVNAFSYGTAPLPVTTDTTSTGTTTTTPTSGGTEAAVGPGSSG